MTMKVELKAFSHGLLNMFKAEAKTNNPSELIQEALLLSGWYAGICYMPNNFEDIINEPREKTVARVNNVLKSGHHSVFEHINLTFMLEGIPKILAMVLNNEGLYSTSEKSARYTKMVASPEEMILYDKWLEIFSEIISKKNPSLKEAHIKKLAQENARYLISVFTPTTMAHTINLRQLNYLMYMMENFIKNSEPTPFNNRMVEVFKEFVKELEPYKVQDLIPEGKNRNLSLFGAERQKEEEFGENYCTTYYGSFAQLAQAHRHRTLKYEMFMLKDPVFFIPPILEDESLIKMWLHDIRSVARNFPQGTMLRITERGTLEDFVLKCRERLCGHAQLEIMNQSLYTLFKYYNITGNKYVKRYLSDYRNKAKCAFPYGTCKHPCTFGPKNSLTRLI